MSSMLGEISLLWWNCESFDSYYVCRDTLQRQELMT
jgi:hypothetical protein